MSSEFNMYRSLTFTKKKKQADQALCEFLQEIKDADVASLQLDEIISILVRQCSQDQPEPIKTKSNKTLHPGC